MMRLFNILLVKSRSTPVVYLAFSNNEHFPLPELINERKEIQKAFNIFDQRRLIRLVYEDHARSIDIIDFFAENEKVTIFHFGGHSNGASLKTEDTNLILKGLAAYLNEEKKLRLVFLNGCSNAGCIHEFLKNKNLAIVATNRSIEDEIAKEFAKIFYLFLSKGKSLRIAFEKTKARFEALDTKTPPLEIRGLGVGRSKNNGKEHLPWGLYYDANNEQILDWKLQVRSEYNYLSLVILVVFLVWLTIIICKFAFSISEDALQICLCMFY